MKDNLNPLWIKRIEEQEGKKDGVSPSRSAGLLMLESDHGIDAIVNCFRSEVYDPTFHQRRDSDPNLLGCDNGYVDIRDGSFHPHCKDVLITRSVGYFYFESENDYDPAIMKEVEAFVNQVMPLSDELRFFQQYSGYCLRGDHPEKIVVIFKDKSGGWNSKSKTTELLKRTMGEYATGGKNQHIYKSSRQPGQNKHNASIFAYEGFRLVIFEELDDKNEVDTKKGKHEHGGNAVNKGRQPGSKHQEDVPCISKWIMVFNDKCEPKYDTGDEAFAARLCVIPFRAKFFKDAAAYEEYKGDYKHMADTNIDDKFARWRPYVLKWMMEGHQSYEREKFTIVPQEFKNWLADVAKAVENLEDWIEDNIEKTDDDDDRLTLVEIKARLPSEVKKRFKTKEHLIGRLKEHMEGFKADTII
ncbi:hypothetical protein HDV00_008980 [Rhizophlyctis rosea]|nr:hypothetical protein HDV00_008980 [Rhizophlyctis rosea]